LPCSRSSVSAWRSASAPIYLPSSLRRHVDRGASRWRDAPDLSSRTRRPLTLAIAPTEPPILPDAPPRDAVRNACLSRYRDAQLPSPSPPMRSSPCCAASAGRRDDDWTLPTPLVLDAVKRTSTCDEAQSLGNGWPPMELRGLRRVENSPC
jgi:hypothetical protein